MLFYKTLPGFNEMLHCAHGKGSVSVVIVTCIVGSLKVQIILIQPAPVRWGAVQDGNMICTKLQHQVQEL